ncbi:MAG: PIG-L family deacetylase [Solirubrobacteraceae bacterium]|nr:PIG-L family deacetylase [Solirubrobacteraceae bacterium]
MDRSTPDAIVLSPHLDDAALGLGAWISRQARTGARVEVWTVYTAGPAVETLPERLRPFGDYATRLAEDTCAVERLGATPRHLGVWERIWRDPPLGRLRDAFHTPPDPAAFTERARVASIAAEALDTGAQVCAPLGIGNHVDHVEVTLGTLDAARSHEHGDRVAFYEDFYALSEALRRRHPIAARRPVAWWRTPGWAAPPAGALLRAGALVPRGPGLDRYVPEVTAAPWRCAPEPVGPADEAAKLAAIADYRSQAALLGPAARLLPAVIRRGHQTHGGELLWRMQE